MSDCTFTDEPKKVDTHVGPLLGELIHQLDFE